MNNQTALTIMALLFISVVLTEGYLFLQIGLGILFLVVMLSCFDPLEGIHERIEQLEKEGVIPL